MVTKSADVVGRPFPIADAIKSKCDEFRENICSQVKETLARLSEEPRDQLWAREKEEALRQQLMVDEPGEVEVLALECRTSICALQIRSRAGPYAGPSYAFGKLNGLRIGPGTIGYEVDNGGTKITVSLVVFTRR